MNGFVICRNLNRRNVVSFLLLLICGGSTKNHERGTRWGFGENVRQVNCTII